MDTAVDGRAYAEWMYRLDWQVLEWKEDDFWKEKAVKEIEWGNEQKHKSGRKKDDREEEHEGLTKRKDIEKDRQEGRGKKSEIEKNKTKKQRIYNGTTFNKKKKKRKEKKQDECCS